MPSDELGPRSLSSVRVRVDGAESVPIDSGWEAAVCPPDTVESPDAIEGLEWIAATVPGTAAAALQAAGRWRPGEAFDFDADDWWFRTRFEAGPAADGEQVLLCFDGLATVAEAFLNGERILTGESMFVAHAIEVGEQLRAGENELAIRCRALAPLLRVRRKPRARWRTKLADGGLRFFRTMLLGRAPGFAPGPAAVGPWRPVHLERRRRVAVERHRLRTRLDDEGTGVLVVAASLRGLGGLRPRAAALELSGPSGSHGLELETLEGPEGFEVSGELRIPRVARWWPHTHGDPALHEVRLRIEVGEESVVVELGRVGFRELRGTAERGGDAAVDGLDLHVNGVRVFARGAVWPPVDPIGFAATEEELRAALETAREAGMNMLRIPGTGAYESPVFHELCAELGILVWQDFMFANFDYPFADEEFLAAVEAEAVALLDLLGGGPSLAVLCGNSEVEQQVAMLGLDPAQGRGEVFGELLPRLIAAAEIDATYVPSAPCGGNLPFRPDRGIANYYGVGGYRRPLEDARRAEVRFAAECLAFANVPDRAGVEALMPEAPSEIVVHHPRWKAGVPRDAGAGWDFDDVRDHYLELLFGVDPGELRRVDHDRYLELSRAVSGEAMAAVFGEWRRAASPCGGGLVLWMRDLLPGAGWGLIDHDGTPKCAYHHLRRALAPTAVWMTDEGLGGVAVHVANDGPEALGATLRVALYRDFEQPVGEAREEVRLDPHASLSLDLEALLGRFVDASWSYRFGPPAQDVIVASLEREAAAGEETISQALHFPAGRPAGVESPQRLEIEAEAERGEGGELQLVLGARRLVLGLCADASGFEPGERYLFLEPGHPRTVSMRALAEEPADAVRLSALNMLGGVTIPVAAQGGG